MKHIHVYLQKATIQHTTQYHKPIIKQIRLRILFIDYYDYYDLYIFFFKVKKIIDSICRPILVYFFFNKTRKTTEHSHMEITYLLSKNEVRIRSP